MNIGRPVSNRYKVPAKQWEKWSNTARRVFNGTYFAMRPSMQFAFLHPKAAPISREHWDTVRWNAAWMAAETVA